MPRVPRCVSGGIWPEAQHRYLMMAAKVGASVIRGRYGLTAWCCAAIKKTRAGPVGTGVLPIGSAQSRAETFSNAVTILRKVVGGSIPFEYVSGLRVRDRRRGSQWPACFCFRRSRIGPPGTHPAAGPLPGPLCTSSFPVRLIGHRATPWWSVGQAHTENAA